LSYIFLACSDYSFNHAVQGLSGPSCDSLICSARLIFFLQALEVVDVDQQTQMAA